MNEEKHKFNWKKLAWSALGIFVALNAAMILIGMNGDRIVQWMANRQYQGTMETYAKEAARIKALEMADTYGSTTPEGTLELLIAALEGGDIQLASKYYYVLDQEKALAEYQKELQEKGNLEMSLRYFKDVRGGEKHYDNATERYAFTHEYVYTLETEEKIKGTDRYIVIPAGEKVSEAVSLQINQYTGQWKIIEN